MNIFRKKFIIGVASAVIAVAAIGSVLAYRMATSPYVGEATRIYIPSNATKESVRDSLEAKFGGYGRKVYSLWSHSKGTAPRAHGSYVVEPGTKALSLSRRLKAGRQTPVKITFNNVRTVGELAQRLSAKMEWPAEDFMAACDSVLAPKGFSKPQYAAAFLPDTYEFYWTTGAGDVVKSLSDFRDKYWNEERRAKAAALGLNPVKAATLASIVEEETNKSEERGNVARLYLNRLNKGMLLQADPTVKFAVGDFKLKRILKKHLAVESPYNTYKNIGLPPGPIRIVERKTLDSVLDAPQHNYLYMCAKEDFSGYHNFAVDYATHQINARRYQQALNRRSIK